MAAKAEAELNGAKPAFVLLELRRGEGGPEGIRTLVLMRDRHALLARLSYRPINFSKTFFFLTKYKSEFREYINLYSLILSFVE